MPKRKFEDADVILVNGLCGQLSDGCGQLSDGCDPQLDGCDPQLDGGSCDNLQLVDNDVDCVPESSSSNGIAPEICNKSGAFSSVLH